MLTKENISCINRDILFVLLKSNREDISIYIFHFFYLMAAAVEDVRCSKVSNVLIFLGYLISVIYQCIIRRNIFMWLTGVFVPVLVLFVLFYFKMLGAGDIKILSVLGGFYGWNQSLKLFCIALLYGALWSVIKLMIYHNVKERFIYFIQYLSVLWSTGKRVAYRTESSDEKRYTIPFTVTILMAYGTCLLGGVC